MTSDQVKQVKEANDIVDVVGNYVALRQAGPTFKGLCPFHDDRHPSFDVDPRRQRYRCWACGKYGDVFSFVQEHEKVGFREALEMLARRANIPLEDDSPERAAHEDSKTQLRDVIRWAAEQYHHCFFEEPYAEPARRYMGERKLLGPTLRKFGIGFAPPAGDWLVQRAAAANTSFDLLEKVGLIARRSEGSGYYDRFRDRVMFPIRDPLGREVAFGGRILPESPAAAKSPKYYNSPDTPLFTKSEHLFGIDLARNDGAKAGYLAVVEGYTDVLMSHQCGICPVVATMGTALNARHVNHLRRYVKRVVLVFDADAGGDTGVDRALEIFASEEVDLAIATLPEGLDPCDLLTQPDGADRFQMALTSAVDALDYKLERLLASSAYSAVEGRRRAVDAILSVIAAAPEMPGHAGAVKQELIVSRISQRLALKEETIWARLNELRAQKPRGDAPPSASMDRPAAEAAERKARPVPEERQLLEVLLAEPALVPVAAAAVSVEEIGHPGLRRFLEELFRLTAAGEAFSLDLLRARIDHPALAEWILKLHDMGQLNSDRATWLQQVLQVFRQRRAQAEKRELTNQLHAAPDHGTAVELLRQLQNQMPERFSTRGS